MIMKREILGCLTDDDWKVLLENARQVSYGKGDIILEEGSKMRAIFVLDRGYASIESSDRGRGIRLNQIGPGEIFGEVSFLEEEGASASVIAEEDAQVKIIDETQLQSLLNSVPGLSARFYQSLALTLAQRLRRLSDRISAAQSQAQETEKGYQVPRIGNISESQVPNSLVAVLDNFRSELLQVERQLKARKMAPSEGRDRVVKSCDLLLEEFAKQIAGEALVDRGWDDLLSFRDTTQLEAGIGDYVFREAFPLLMRSATIACCHSRGRSYANDYLIGEIIEDDDPAGDGWLGPHVDAWFLSRPFCQAYRHGRRLLRKTIAAAAQSRSSRVRVTSLASGNAREMFRLLDRTRDAELYATCIDSSPEALAFNARRAQELRLTSRVTVLQGDIRALVEGRDRLALPPQNVIYGLDLCDRWEDDRVLSLLEWTYDRLAAGGTAVFTNFKPNLPDRLLLKHVLNWQQHERTEGDWRTLCDRSRFGAAAVQFKTEETGWLLLAIVSKS